MRTQAEADRQYRIGLVVLQALLIVVALVFTAAASCAKGTGETMGRSSYLQSYSIPVVGTVPPLKPSIYNDEFNAQKPIHPDDTAFVSLGSKWSSWDFGDAMEAAWIDPRMQMAQIVGVGDKAWHGVKQSLPLPTAGNPVNYVIYTRCMNYAAGASYGDFGGMFFGTVLGEDLTDDASQFFAIQSAIQRDTDTFSGITTAALWPSYDTLDPGADGEMDCGWPAQFHRAIVSSSRDSEGAYTTGLRLQASVDGLGFQDVFRWSGLDYPLRHLALAQRTEIGILVGTLWDYVRYFDDEEALAVTGRIQQIGSV